MLQFWPVRLVERIYNSKLVSRSPSQAALVIAAIVALWLGIVFGIYSAAPRAALATAFSVWLSPPQLLLFCPLGLVVALLSCYCSMRRLAANLADQSLIAPKAARRALGALSVAARTANQATAAIALPVYVLGTFLIHQQMDASFGIKVLVVILYCGLAFPTIVAGMWMIIHGLLALFLCRRDVFDGFQFNPASGYGGIGPFLRLILLCTMIWFLLTLLTWLVGFGVVARNASLVEVLGIRESLETQLVPTWFAILVLATLLIETIAAVGLSVAWVWGLAWVRSRRNAERRRLRELARQRWPVHSEQTTAVLVRLCALELAGSPVGATVNVLAVTASAVASVYFLVDAIL